MTNRFCLFYSSPTRFSGLFAISLIQSTLALSMYVPTTATPSTTPNSDNPHSDNWAYILGMILGVACFIGAASLYYYFRDKINEKLCCQKNQYMAI